MTRVLRNIEQFRKRSAVIDVGDIVGRACAAAPVWVEQETHDFEFGVILPNMDPWPENGRERCLERAAEVFNKLVRCGESLVGDPDRTLVDLTAESYDGPTAMPLARIARLLDGRAGAGSQLVILLSGQTIARVSRSQDRARERASLTETGAMAISDRDFAKRVTDLYAVCFSHPAARGIYWQGFVDREPSAAGAGLLRDDLSPKPAFQMLRKLTDEIWHTRASGTADADGRYSFRGYLGQYRLVVHPSGADPVVKSFSLREDKECG